MNVSPVTRNKAAELLQVSPRSVVTAAKVERTAPSEVIEAVKTGNISLNMAAQVAEIRLNASVGLYHFARSR